ncbi:MAG: PepSY domain-containing protein [Desulfobulbaceae bacterium]|nr:PepSY domain-containing protein [Desulfobulbaceae bacterium]HIJ80002.1 PepSY domain-containing protein [Deltaproteobacteria bacterium]
MTKKSSLALWRKIHIYSFGYLKWPSIFVSVIFVIICLTGILYNHTHDFEILKKGRISTSFLPDSYQKQLDQTRKAQGLEDLFPEEADRVPVIWLIKDLHTGDFFGPWGRIFYDILSISLIVLAVTGCYLFLKINIPARAKRKGDS